MGPLHPHAHSTFPPALLKWQVHHDKSEGVVERLVLLSGAPGAPLKLLLLEWVFLFGDTKAHPGESRPIGVFVILSRRSPSRRRCECSLAPRGAVRRCKAAHDGVQCSSTISDDQHRKLSFPAVDRFGSVPYPMSMHVL